MVFIMQWVLIGYLDQSYNTTDLNMADGKTSLLYNKPFIYLVISVLEATYYVYKQICGIF